MDLRLFEKSPHLNGLLVSLYDSHKLYELSNDSTPENRARLSGMMANILETKLSIQEQEVVADVLIALIRQAELDLRSAMAERLSRMDHVPLRLVLHLVNDQIEVAGPMLRSSPVLSDLDLVYIIKSQGAAYWQAIAVRENLSEALIDLLVDTKELGTALCLSTNDRIRLTTHALDVLVKMASKDEALARPLLTREEMPPALARSLYAHVGEELKKYITCFYETVPAAIARATDDIILEFVDPLASLPERDFMPTDDMLVMARRMSNGQLINMNTIMDTLKKSNLRLFIALLGVHTGILPGQIHDMLKQTSGQKLAILCRAYGMQKNDFSTVYLLTHRMRSAARLVNHKDLLTALNYFDKVRPEAARLVLDRSRSRYLN